MKKVTIKHNGVEYKHIELESPSNGAIHLLDTKYIINGKPDITITKGSYKHGDEVQFRIWNYKTDGFAEKKRHPSRYNSVEIYLPKEEAIKLLKETLYELTGNGIYK